MIYFVFGKAYQLLRPDCSTSDMKTRRTGRQFGRLGKPRKMKPIPYGSCRASTVAHRAWANGDAVPRFCAQR